MNAEQKSALQLASEAIAVLFDPGGVVELRVHGSRFGYKAIVASGYFTDHGELARRIVACSDGNLRRGYEVSACYYTLNTVHPDLLARYEPNQMQRDPHLGVTKDKEIVKRTHLLVDCDPIRPADLSSTDPEKELAAQSATQIKQFLTSKGWPDPIECDSGNGHHLIYRVDLTNDEQSHAMIKNCLTALASRFDTPCVKVDQTVHNASRITKSYGSVARKGPNSPQRPHRRSRMLAAPTEIKTVSLELLLALAAESPTPIRVALSTDNSDSSITPPEVFESQLDAVGVEHDGASPYEGGWLWRPAVCVFNASHVRSSIIVGIRASGAFYYRCLHNGCVGNDWEKFRARVEFDSGKKMKFGVPDNRVLSWIQSDEKAVAAWNAQGDFEAGFEYLFQFMRERRVDIDQWLRLYEASPLKLALDAQIPEYIRNS
jgi:hypothetical protein